MEYYLKVMRGEKWVLVSGLRVLKKGNRNKKKVKNIQYDLDGMFGFEFYSNGRTREEILSSLPKSIEVEIEDPDGIEWSIQKNIEDATGWLVVGFDFEFNGEFTSWQKPKKPDWMIKEQKEMVQKFKEMVQKEKDMVLKEK